MEYLENYDDLEGLADLDLDDLTFDDLPLDDLEDFGDPEEPEEKKTPETEDTPEKEETPETEDTPEEEGTPEVPEAREKRVRTEAEKQDRAIVTMLSVVLALLVTLIEIGRASCRERV